MVIQSGTLLYGEPTLNRAPTPSSTQNNNSAQAGTSGSNFLPCQRQWAEYWIMMVLDYVRYLFLFLLFVDETFYYTNN